MGRKKFQINEEELRKLYIDEKKSVRDIAEILGVSDRLIKNRLKEFGNLARDRIEAVKKGIKEKLKKVIDRDILYDLYINQNKSSREIEKILNISFRTIITNLKQYNITVKKPSKAFLGKKLSNEHKNRIGDAHRGSKSPHWKGGISGVANCIRRSEKYNQWRMTCLERDQYTCQHCGDQPGRLHVDHIKPFALILKENNIQTTNEAMNCEELWNIKNGKTLCVSCHRKTCTWGYKTTKLIS